MKRRPSSSSPKSVDKSCSIADHDNLKASLTAWLACRFVGFMSFAGITYEMRDCPRCASTMNKPAEVLVKRYLDEPPPAASQVAQKRRKHAPQITAEARGAA
jgi:hypothetical protein